MAKMRSVEYYRLWPGNQGDSGTWDTDFIDIPADTPEDKVEEAVREAATHIGAVMTGLYCDTPEDDDGEESG